MRKEQKPRKPYAPEAGYPCVICAGDYSHPAYDLFWSRTEHDWICPECQDQINCARDLPEADDEHLGVRLADFLKSATNGNLDA